MQHCDEIIEDEAAPKVLRDFLRYHRLPAVCKAAGIGDEQAAIIKDMIEPDLRQYRQYLWTDPEPILFAEHKGKRVRVVMASRFGDVGITENLSARRGYELRVMVADLSNFSDKQ